MTPNEFADNYAQENGYDGLEQFVYEIDDYQVATMWIKNMLVAFNIELVNQQIKRIKNE